MEANHLYRMVTDLNPNEAKFFLALLRRMQRIRGTGICLELRAEPHKGWRLSEVTRHSYDTETDG